MWRQVASLGFAVVLSASVAMGAAQEISPMDPLGKVETLNGRVQVRGDGRSFVVTLTRAGSGERRQFEIGTSDRPGKTFRFSSQNAEIHYWRGHVVVVAPTERRALHFSLEGIDKLLVAGQEGARHETAAFLSELDTLLRSSYDLTNIETAVSIIAKNEQALRLPRDLGQKLGATDIDYPDTGGSGGLGGCGSSCTMSCGDGSSCSATCTAPRCARCSCPASCSCS